MASPNGDPLGLGLDGDGDIGMTTPASLLGISGDGNQQPQGAATATTNGLDDEDLMFLMNYELINDTEMAGSPAVVAAPGVPSTGLTPPIGMTPPTGLTPGLPSPGLSMDSGLLASPLGTGAALGGMLPAAVPASTAPATQTTRTSATSTATTTKAKTKGRSRGKTAASAGDSEQDKRAKRLARNRESARQSRLRKKQHLELLEEKVSQLTTELDELARAHLARAETELRVNMHRLLESCEDIANQPASNQTNQRLAGAVAALREKFGPDCKERRAVRDFYFDQLQRLLLPPHTRLMLYLIGQGDHFFERSDGGSGDSGGIWRTLCRDIGLTPEQEERLKAALKKERDTPKHVLETKTLESAADFVVRFRKSMFDRAAELDSQMSGMYSVLAPAQALRYMLWVERNRGRLQTGLGSGGNASSARPASGVKTAASPRVATGSGATAGAGGGASVSALIGAARSTAAPAGSASGASVQQLDTARLEDVLLQKPDGDLTMADLGILATPTPGARNAGPGAAAPRSQ